MNLNVIKNIQFTRLAKATGRLREFNFRRIAGAPEETFHVDVSDDRGNRIIFKMQKPDSTHWKIINSGLPEWIYETEKQLNDLIEEELSHPM